MSRTAASAASPAGAAATAGPAPQSSGSAAALGGVRALLRCHRVRGQRGCRLPCCPRTAPCSVGAERQKRITAFASRLNAPDVRPWVSQLQQAVTGGDKQPCTAVRSQRRAGRRGEVLGRICAGRTGSPPSLAVGGREDGWDPAGPPPAVQLPAVSSENAVGTRLVFAQGWFFLSWLSGSR